jgi:hypothetical protein
MPQNANLTGFSPDFGPDSLIINLTAQGSGGGNSNFSQSLPGIGPFAPGTYTVCVNFTLNGNLVDTWCDELIIIAGTDPYAGEFGILENVCTGADDIPLISILGGTPDTDGTWLDPNSQVVQNGLFDPGQSPEGPYTYYFDVQEPCIDASQQVVITYAAETGNSGFDGELQVCANHGDPVDLFTVLGGTPDAGGTWSFESLPHSSTFTPVVDECGDYVYTVPAEGSCPPASSIVTVICVNPPNAGNPNIDTLVLCWNDTIELMQTRIIGEQNTGYWIGPSGFAVGFYNDSINVSVNGAGPYGYVVPSNFCPYDTSFIYVVLWGDGIPNCQQVIGMTEADGGLARFDVLPNPAQDQVTIDIELARTGGSHALEIMDMDGKTVRSQALVFNGLLSRQTVSVGELARGVYLVRISSAEGRAVRRLMLH